jgi:hypothetical protein
MLQFQRELMSVVFDIITYVTTALSFDNVFIYFPHVLRTTFLDGHVIYGITIILFKNFYVESCPLG